MQNDEPAVSTAEVAEVPAEFSPTIHPKPEKRTYRKTKKRRVPKRRATKSTPAGNEYPSSGDNDGGSDDFDDGLGESTGEAATIVAGEPIESPAGPPKGPRAFPRAPRSKQAQGGVDPDAFFQYWRELPAEFADRLVVYINRQWPVMNFILLLTPEERRQVEKRQRKPPKKYITKYLECFESENWREEILRRHGSGDYKLYLNDSGAKGIAPQNICKTTISLRDDDYPPVIEDYRAVDPDDPANSAYLEKMRLHGRLNDPTVGDFESEDENEMADATVVRELTGALKDSNERMLQMSQAQNKPPAAPPVDVTATTALRVAEVMADGAKRSNELLTDTMRAMQAQQTAANDPKQYVQDVMEFAQKLQAPQAGAENNSMVQYLMAESQRKHEMALAERKSDDERHQRELELVREQGRQQVAALEQRLAALEQARPAAPAVQNEDQFLDKMVRLKEKLDTVLGGSGDDSDGVPKWVPTAMTAGKWLLDAGMNIAHNIAVARSQQGTPATPATLEPAQSLEPGEAPQEKGFAQEIRQPLEQALQAKMPGNEFAARIIMGMGTKDSWRLMTENGPAGVLTELQADPQTWSMFQRFGAGGQNGQFIEDFCDETKIDRSIETIRTQASGRQQGQQAAAQAAAGGGSMPPQGAGPRVVRPTA